MNDNPTRGRAACHNSACPPEPQIWVSVGGLSEALGLRLATMTALKLSFPC